MTRLPLPVIAAIDGASAGIGCDIALAADIRLVSERAFFAEIFVNINLMPDGGGSFTLSRLVGTGRALEMAMTGCRVPAEDAERWGLANHVYPSDGFEASVQQFAAQLAAKAPLSIARSKAAIRQNQNPVTFEQALKHEAVTQQELCETHDFGEGVMAFLEKRGKRTGKIASHGREAYAPVGQPAFSSAQLFGTICRGSCRRRSQLLVRKLPAIEPRARRSSRRDGAAAPDADRHAPSVGALGQNAAAAGSTISRAIRRKRPRLRSSTSPILPTDQRTKTAGSTSVCHAARRSARFVTVTPSTSTSANWHTLRPRGICGLHFPHAAAGDFLGSRPRRAASAGSTPAA